MVGAGDAQWVSQRRLYGIGCNTSKDCRLTRNSPTYYTGFCLCQLGEVGPLWFLRSAVAHAQNLGLWEVEAGGLSKDYSWGFIVSS